MCTISDLVWALPTRKSCKKHSFCERGLERLILGILEKSTHNTILPMDLERNSSGSVLQRLANEGTLLPLHVFFALCYSVFSEQLCRMFSLWFLCFYLTIFNAWLYFQYVAQLWFVPRQRHYSIK